MATISFLDFCEDTTAEESFLGNTINPTKIIEGIKNFLREFIARIQTKVMELQGYYIYRDSEELMKQIYTCFVDLIDCINQDNRYFWYTIRYYIDGDISIKQYRSRMKDLEDERYWKFYERINKECHDDMIEFKERIMASKKEDVEDDIIPFSSASSVYLHMAKTTRILQKAINDLSNLAQKEKETLNYLANRSTEIDLSQEVQTYYNKRYQRFFPMAQLYFESLSCLKAKPLGDKKVTEAGTSIPSPSYSGIISLVESMIDHVEFMISKHEMDVDAVRDRLASTPPENYTTQDYVIDASNYWNDECRSRINDIKNIMETIRDYIKNKSTPYDITPHDLASMRMDIDRVTGKIKALKGPIEELDPVKKEIKRLKLEKEINTKLVGARKEIISLSKYISEAAAYLLKKR